MPAPWLALIGLGEDGATGLSREALAALNEAEIVFGGERHIALVGSVPGELRPWPQPFRNALPQPQVLPHRCADLRVSLRQSLPLRSQESRIQGVICRCLC